MLENEYIVVFNGSQWLLFNNTADSYPASMGTKTDLMWSSRRTIVIVLVAMNDNDARAVNFIIAESLSLTCVSINTMVSNIITPAIMGSHEVLDPIANPKLNADICRAFRDFLVTYQ